MLLPDEAGAKDGAKKPIHYSHSLAELRRKIRRRE
jgi:hypothetical protein